MSPSVRFKICLCITLLLFSLRTASAQFGPMLGGQGGAPIAIGVPVSLGSSISTAAIRSSWTLTTVAAIPAGSLAVVCTQAPFSGAQTISSISDGTNTYTAGVTNAFEGVTDLLDSCWYKENAAAVSSSATITVTYSGSTVAQPSIINAFYSTGILATSSIDKSNSGLVAGGTAYASGTTGTLSQANELIVGFVAMYNANATITEGSGFTNTNTTAQGSGAFYQSRLSYAIVGTTTAVNYQPSASLSTFGKALIVTFKGH